MSENTNIGNCQLADLLESIAARTPSPGGGSVAAITLGTAAALCSMVVNYSLGKQSLQQHSKLLEDSSNTLDETRKKSLILADEDTRAYEKLNALQKLDETNARRIAEWENVVKEAINVPRRILRNSVAVLEICKALCNKSNHWLKSDLAIAAVLAEAAVASAAWNVRINLPLLGNQEEANTLENELQEELSRSKKLCEDIQSICK